MSRVRGLGARLLASVAATGVAAAIFFGLLGMWPDLAVLKGGGFERSLTRSFALGASLAMVFGLATMFVFYGLLALQRWRWAIMAGYPTWVVLDVLCDSRRDAGHLINGTADFAFVTGPVRHSLLALRRTRMLVLVFAAVIALAGVSHWITRWLMGGGSDPAQSVAVLWSMPLLTLFVIWFLLGLPEWRVRRRERMPAARRTSGESVPPPRGELVKMWMASAERARKSLGEDASGQG